MSGEAPHDSIVRVWHWKATRTNPQGFAMDRTHRYTRAQREGKGRSHPARNGQPIWIARPGVIDLAFAKR